MTVAGNELRFLFGSKVVKLIPGDGPEGKLLRQELSLYRETTAEPDIEIRILKSLDVHVKSQNPSSHMVIDGGFLIDFGWYSVAWYQKDQKIRVDILVEDKLRSYLRKALSIQFAHPFETIGQVLHEIVLLPSLMMFLSHELTIIHGCALESPTGHGIIFGGTGGVGKTSAAIELVLRKRYKFLSDDISIVDTNGYIFANYSYPKIYGYNVIDDPEVGTKIFSRMGLVDRLHWLAHLKRSPSKVRRRANPMDLFDGKVAQKAKLTTFYMLYRGNYSAPSCEVVDPERVVEMNLSVLRAEYNIIYDQLLWNHFNLLVDGAGSSISINQIFDNWRDLQHRVFSSVECVLVRLPMKFTSREWREYLATVLP